MENVFEIDIDQIKLFDPFRFELTVIDSRERAFLSFQIENAMKKSDLKFKIVDSDIIVEELL